MKTLKSTVNFRIDDETLKEFKKVCGDMPYQSKIREIMRQYIRQCKLEKEKKMGYMKVDNIQKDFDTNFDI